jgi:phosphoglycolate phosphatase
MAERRFELVVFDWDGTLVDSTTLIAEAILGAADDIGVQVPDRGQAWHVIGLGLAQALARVVPGLPPQQIGAFVARYQARYRAAEGQIRLFAGAPQMLDTLRARRVRMAIATGKTRVGLARSLDSAGLAEHFVSFRCSDQTHPKPHPAMLEELAEELEVAPEAMLMIGDTSHDLEMAAAARVAAVGVAYGAHPRAELERLGPLQVFDSVPALSQWLLARVASTTPSA